MPDYSDAMMDLMLIENKIGSPLTDEQRNFAVDFTRDIITFANPGTAPTLSGNILYACIMKAVFR